MTRARVAALTSSLLLKAREAVVTETPAARATSRIVTVIRELLLDGLARLGAGDIPKRYR